MRKPRQILIGVPHHLMIQGNNRRNLFSYPWEYDELLRLLEDALEQYPQMIHAFCIMKNHLHILVTPGPDFPKFVQYFLQRYAQRRNARTESSGKLFRERYKLKVITDIHYLAWCTAYIELNPVRAGLCQHPSEWRWSTYNLHVGAPSKISRKLWTPSEWFLQMGAERYAEWVEHVRLTTPPEEKTPERRLRRPDGSRAN